MNQDEVRDVINFHFPKGTRGTPSVISEIPIWPVDIFAIAAHFAQITDCYTELLDFSSPTSLGSLIRAEHTQLCAINVELGQYIHLNALPYEYINTLDHLWVTLVNGSNPPYSLHEWKEAVASLLIIADTTCEGIGFFDPSTPPLEDPHNEFKFDGWIPQVYNWMQIPTVYEKLKDLLQDESILWYSDGRTYVKSLPTLEKKSAKTACLMIDPQRLSVLPKSLTPRFGCTIRSLTKNLSLHPGIGQVQSNWYNHKFDSKFSEQSLNILIVPYPFKISASISFSMQN